jgi:O-antigen/teichoic acid export membrane protein
MSILKKIVSQSAIYFVGTIFSVLLGFFFKIYISSILGAEGLGLFALGVSSISIASIFLTWGYGNGLIRFISKYSANKDYSRLFFYIKKTFLINLVMVTSLSSIYFIFPEFIAKHLLHSQEISKYLPLFGIYLIISSFLSIGDQIIRGFQEVKKSTVVHHFIRLPFKIVIAVILIKSYNLYGYIAAELLGGVLAIFLLFFIIKKLLPAGYSFFKNKISNSNLEEKRYARNMLVIVVLGVLQNHGEKIMLVYFLSTSDLGIYSVVLSIVAFIPTILNSVNSIFSPMVSQFHEKNEIEKLSYYFKLSVRYIFILSFPFIAFLTLYSKNVLLFFGSDFEVGNSLLILIIIGELINVSFGTVGSMLKMMGFDKKIKNISAITSIIAFVSAYFFIDLFGIIGVGFSYILKNVLYNLWSSIVIYKKKKINVFDMNYIKSIALFFGVFALCYFFLVFNNLSAIQIILIIGFYYAIFLLLWYAVLGKKELPQIMDLLKNDK